MTNTAGESSAPVPEVAPDRAPDSPPPLSPPSSPGESTPGAGTPGTPGTTAPPRTTGVRWGDGPSSTSGPGSASTPDAGTAATGRDEDATPPSGFAAPGAGDVMPARTSGTAPEPAPGATWPNPTGPPGPWQQTTPGWAPAAVAPPPDPARRRRGRRIALGVVLGIVVLGLVVVALLAFLVGPRFARYDVLDRAAVERGVTDVVTRDWKRQVGGVTCPDGERVRPGTTFSCTATVDGKPARIPVDVVDDSGAYEVGQPR